MCKLSHYIAPFFTNLSYVSLLSMFIIQFVLKFYNSAKQAFRLTRKYGYIFYICIFNFLLRVHSYKCKRIIMFLCLKVTYHFDQFVDRY